MTDGLLYQWIVLTFVPYQYNDQINKKAIELLDADTSVPYSRKGLGYTIGCGLDAVLLFTCYSYWFSCYLDHRGKLMKALACT
jgi:hypothetical protein